MARAFGFSVRSVKTNFMVVGDEVVEIQKRPTALDNGQIKWVTEFPYFSVPDNRDHTQEDLVFLMTRGREREGGAGEWYGNRRKYGATGEMCQEEIRTAIYELRPANWVEKGPFFSG